MAPNRRERDWPVPDAIHQIKTALVKEKDSGTNLVAMSLNQVLGEVSLADRDGAVHFLRFLKFWFNLPSTVFITSTNILDRFLTKMKVQRRYLTCLVISCLNIATRIHQYKIDPKTLVNVSQSRCSVKDMERMTEIVKKKLELGSGRALATVSDYLNQFLDLLRSVARQFKIRALLDMIVKKELLTRHLEVIMCDSHCVSAKPSIIALALIQTEFERFVVNELTSKLTFYPYEILQLFTTLVDLQLICLVDPAEFTTCHKRITDILRNYDNHTKSFHRQNLQWRYSSRTIYTTKSSWDYFNTLETILEQ